MKTDDSTAPGATRRTAIASQAKYDASDIVSRMSDASGGAYRRRPRGAAVGASKLYVRIDPDAASIVDQVAIRLGVSKAEFVERLMFHVGNTLDADGRPPWWPKSPPSPQELPMTD